MPTRILRNDRPKGGLTQAFPARASWGDVVRVFRPLVRGGTKGGWQAGQHEATFAVQLRVYPFFGRGNLPYEAGTPLV